MPSKGSASFSGILEALGIALLLAATVYVVAGVRERTAENRELVLQHHQSALTAIEDFFHFAAGSAATVERSLILHDRRPKPGSLEAIHDRLRTMVDLHAWVEQIVVTRPDGRVVTSSDLVFPADTVFPHPVWSVNLGHSTSIRVSRPLVSNFGTTRGLDVFFVGQRLVDLDDRPIGHVTLVVSADAFLPPGADTVLRGHGSLILLGNDGSLLVARGLDPAGTSPVLTTPFPAPGLLLRSSVADIGPASTLFWSGMGGVGTAGAVLSFILFFLGRRLRQESIAARERQVAELETAVAERTRELSEANILLRISEDNLNRAQSVANIGSWVLEQDSGTLTWSDQVYEMFGLNSEHFDASYHGFLAQVHPDDRAKVDRAFVESFHDKTSYTIEHRLLRRNGEECWVLERCEHELGDDGNVVRSVGTVQDITERKRAADALAEKTAALERSNADLRQFAYVVSHDLREPLRMVTSYLQLLERKFRDVMDEDARDFVGFAVGGAKRMDVLIKDLLEYSRVDTHGTEMEAVSGGEALLDAIENLQTAITEANARVTFNDLPRVRADRSQLTRVFQNLVGNAVKYRRPNQVPEIRVSASVAGDWATFKVEDNGIGIDPEFRQKVFVIFQRLHGREEYEGTGIGLAICKRIIDRHGGRIWLESEPGEGCRFYFTLRRVAAAP